MEAPPTSHSGAIPITPKPLSAPRRTPRTIVPWFLHPALGKGAPISTNGVVRSSWVQSHAPSTSTIFTPLPSAPGIPITSTAPIPSGGESRYPCESA